MIYLGVVFFLVLVLGIYLDSWIYMSIGFIKLENFSAIIVLNIFMSPFPFWELQLHEY